MRRPNFCSCTLRVTHCFRSILVFDDSMFRSRDMIGKLGCRCPQGGGPLRSQNFAHFWRFTSLHLRIHSQNSVPLRSSWYPLPITRYDSKVFEGRVFWSILKHGYFTPFFCLAPVEFQGEHSASVFIHVATVLVEIQLKSFLSSRTRTLWLHHRNPRRANLSENGSNRGRVK